jgi:hypothetical protein
MKSVTKEIFFSHKGKKRKIKSNMSKDTLDSITKTVKDLRSPKTSMIKIFEVVHTNAFRVNGVNINSKRKNLINKVRGEK